MRRCGSETDSVKSHDSAKTADSVLPGSAAASQYSYATHLQLVQVMLYFSSFPFLYCFLSSSSSSPPPPPPPHTHTLIDTSRLCLSLCSPSSLPLFLPPPSQSQSPLPLSLFPSPPPPPLFFFFFFKSFLSDFSLSSSCHSFSSCRFFFLDGVVEEGRSSGKDVPAFHVKIWNREKNWGYRSYLQEHSTERLLVSLSINPN